MTNKLEITSQGSGIPLVFIHGWGMNSAIWQPVIDVLSADYEVHTVDLPGFAKNRQVSLDSYSIAEIAKLVVKAIDKRAIYIGWSLGGLVTLELALTFPERVLGLMTVASTPCFLEKEAWPGIKPAVLKSFHQQLAEDPAKTIKGFLKIQAMGSPNVRQDIKQVSELVMQHKMPEKVVLDKSLSLLETTDYRNVIAKINQPFCRLYGRLDGLVPKKVINLIDDLAPQSQSHIFEQASHAPFISQPNEFIDYLTMWVKSIKTL